MLIKMKQTAKVKVNIKELALEPAKATDKEKALAVAIVMVIANEMVLLSKTIAYHFL